MDISFAFINMQMNVKSCSMGASRGVGIGLHSVLFLSYRVVTDASTMT